MGQERIQYIPDEEGKRTGVGPERETLYLLNSHAV